MKKIWMRRMEQGQLAETDSMATRDRPRSMNNERSFDRNTRTSRHKGSQRSVMKLNSPEGQDFTEKIKRTNFDSNFRDQYWRIEGVQLVENERLKRNYKRYRDELLALGRKQEEMKEIFVFSAETKNACEEICKNGHRIGLKKRHVLGHTGSGVHLVRHYDILTRYMIFQQFSSPAYILVYKTFLGKSKPIVPRLHKDDNFVRPYVGFDCHISARPVEANMHACEALNCSYLYAYEYDEVSSNPVRHPRQILPYAIIHLETKPPISLENPFLAVRSGNKITNWEVKGETRRGFRFISRPSESRRKTKRSPRHSVGFMGKACLKDQLLEMRTKGDLTSKATPPTLVKYDKDKIKDIQESKEKEPCKQPPSLQKFGTCTVNFAGEKFSIPPNDTHKDKTERRIGGDSNTNDRDTNVKTDSFSKERDSMNDTEKNTKTKTRLCQTKVYFKPRVRKLSHSGLPLSLKPYVKLKRLDSCTYKTKQLCGKINVKNKWIRKSSEYKRLDDNSKIHNSKDNENVNSNLGILEEKEPKLSNKAHDSQKSDNVNMKSHFQANDKNTKIIKQCDSIAVKEQEKTVLSNELEKDDREVHKDVTPCVSKPNPKEIQVSKQCDNLNLALREKEEIEPKQLTSNENTCQESEHVNRTTNVQTMEQNTEAINKCDASNVKESENTALSGQMENNDRLMHTNSNTNVYKPDPKETQVSKHGANRRPRLREKEQHEPKQLLNSVHEPKENDNINRKKHIQARELVENPNASNVKELDKNAPSDRKEKKDRCLTKLHVGKQITKDKLVSKHCVNENMETEQSEVTESLTKQEMDKQMPKEIQVPKDCLNENADKEQSVPNICMSANNEKGMPVLKGCLKNNSEISGSIQNVDNNKKTHEITKVKHDQHSNKERTGLYRHKTTSKKKEPAGVKQTLNSTSEIEKSVLKQSLRSNITGLGKTKRHSRGASTGIEPKILRKTYATRGKGNTKDDVFAFTDDEDNSKLDTFNSYTSKNSCFGDSRSKIKSVERQNKGERLATQDNATLPILGKQTTSCIIDNRNGNTTPSGITSTNVDKDNVIRTTHNASLNCNSSEGSEKNAIVGVKKTREDNLSMQIDKKENKSAKIANDDLHNRRWNDKIVMIRTKDNQYSVKRHDKTVVDKTEKHTTRVSNEAIETRKKDELQKTHCTFETAISGDANTLRNSNDTTQDISKTKQNILLSKTNSETEIKAQTETIACSENEINSPTIHQAGFGICIDSGIPKPPRDRLRETVLQGPILQTQTLPQLLVSNSQMTGNLEMPLQEQEVLQRCKQSATENTFKPAFQLQTVPHYTCIANSKAEMSKRGSPSAAIAAPAILNRSPTVASAQTNEIVNIGSQNIFLYSSSSPNSAIGSSTYPADRSHIIQPAHTDQTYISGNQTEPQFPSTTYNLRSNDVVVNPNNDNWNKPVVPSMIPKMHTTISNTSISIKNPHPLPLRTPPYDSTKPLPTSTMSPPSMPPKAHSSNSVSKAPSVSFSQNLILQQAPPQHSIMKLMQFRQKYPPSQVYIAQAQQMKTSCPDLSGQLNTGSSVSIASMPNQTPMYLNISTIPSQQIIQHPLSATESKSVDNGQRGIQISSTGPLPDQTNSAHSRNTNFFEMNQMLPIGDIAQTAQGNEHLQPDTVTTPLSQSERESTPLDKAQSLASPIEREILPLPRPTSLLQYPRTNQPQQGTRNIEQKVINKKVKQKGTTVDENTAKRLQHFLSKLTWAQRQNLMESKSHTEETSKPQDTISKHESDDRLRKLAGCSIADAKQTNTGSQLSALNVQSSAAFLKTLSSVHQQSQSKAGSDTNTDLTDHSSNLLLLATQSLQVREQEISQIKQVTSNTVKSKQAFIVENNVENPSRETVKHNMNVTESQASYVSKHRDFIAELHDNDSSDTIIGGIEIIPSVLEHSEQHTTDVQAYIYMFDSLGRKVEKSEPVEVDTKHCYAKGIGERSNTILNDVAENAQGHEKQELQKVKECNNGRNRVSLFDNFVPTQSIQHHEYTSTLSTASLIDQIDNDRQNDSLKGVKIKEESVEEHDFDQSDLEKLNQDSRKENTNNLIEKELDSNLTTSSVANSSIYSRLAERRRLNMNTMAKKSPEDCRSAIIETLQELSEVLKFLNDSKQDTIHEHKKSKSKANRSLKSGISEKSSISQKSIPVQHKHVVSSKESSESIHKAAHKHTEEPTRECVSKTTTCKPLSEIEIKQEPIDNEISPEPVNSTTGKNNDVPIPDIVNNRPKHREEPVYDPVKAEPLDSSENMVVSTTDKLKNIITKSVTSKTVSSLSEHNHNQTGGLNEIDGICPDIRPCLNITGNRDSHTLNSEEMFIATKVHMSKPTAYESTSHQETLLDIHEPKSQHEMPVIQNQERKAFSAKTQRARADALPVLFDSIGQPDITTLEAFGNTVLDSKLSTIIRQDQLNGRSETVLSNTHNTANNPQTNNATEISLPQNSQKEATPNAIQPLNYRKPGRLNKSLKERKHMFDLKTRVHQKAQLNDRKGGTKRKTAPHKQTKVVSSNKTTATKPITTQIHLNRDNEEQCKTDISSKQPVLHKTISNQLEKDTHASKTKHTPQALNNNEPVVSVREMSSGTEMYDPSKPTTASEAQINKNVNVPVVTVSTANVEKPHPSEKCSKNSTAKKAAVKDSNNKKTEAPKTSCNAVLMEMAMGKSKTKSKDATSCKGQSKTKSIIPFHVVMQKKREQFRKFRSGLTKDKFINYNEFKAEFEGKSKTNEKYVRKDKGFVKQRAHKVFNFKWDRFNKGNRFRNPKYYVMYQTVQGVKKNDDIGCQVTKRRVAKISDRGTKFFEDFSDSDEKNAKRGRSDDNLVSHKTHHSTSSDHSSPFKKRCLSNGNSDMKEGSSKRKDSRTGSNPRPRSTSKEHSTSSRSRHHSRGRSVHSKSSKGSDKRSRSRSRHHSVSTEGTHSRKHIGNHSRDKSSQRSHISRSRSNSGDSYGGFDANKYITPFGAFDATKYIEKPSTKQHVSPNNQSKVNPYLKKNTCVKTTFKKGGTGYFQWKKKYQPNASSTTRGDYNITRQGTHQTMEEADRWQKFKARESIRIQIENSIKEYRRTFQDTDDDMKGDGKVSSYLHYLTEKLDTIQSKRDQIPNPRMGPDLPIKKANANTNPFRRTESPSTKEPPRDQFGKLKEKLQRSVLRQKDHKERSSKDTTVSTLVSAFTRATDDVPNRLTKKTKVIEGMLRHHLMKHVEHVTNRIKDEITHEIVKGMKDPQGKSPNQNFKGKSFHRHQEHSSPLHNKYRHSSPDKSKGHIYNKHKGTYEYESDSDRNDTRNHVGGYLHYKNKHHKEVEQSRDDRGHFDGKHAHKQRSYQNEYAPTLKDDTYYEGNTSFNEDNYYTQRNSYSEGDSHNDDIEFSNTDREWDNYEDYGVGVDEFEDGEFRYDDKGFDATQYTPTIKTNNNVNSNHQKHKDNKHYNDNNQYRNKSRKGTSYRTNQEETVLPSPSFKKDNTYKISFNRYSSNKHETNAHEKHQHKHFKQSSRGRGTWRGGIYKRQNRGGHSSFNNSCTSNEHKSSNTTENHYKSRGTRGSRGSFSNNQIRHGELHKSHNVESNETITNSCHPHRHQQFNADLVPHHSCSSFTFLEQSITAGLKSLKKETDSPKPIPTISGLRDKSYDIHVAKPPGFQYPYPSASSTSSQ